MTGPTHFPGESKVIQETDTSRSERSNEGMNAFVVTLVYLLCAAAVVWKHPVADRVTMCFYVAATTLAVFFAWLAQPGRNVTLRLWPLGISLMISFFVLGFRESGLDDEKYMTHFYHIRAFGMTEFFRFSTMEPGYIFLSAMIGKTGCEYFTAQLVFTLIPLLVFYLGFVRLRSMISLPMAVLLLYSTFYFLILAVALVRMFIAISLVFYAMIYLWEMKPLKYAAMILVAATFHYSAAIFLPLVFFGLNKNTMLFHWKKVCAALLIVLPLLVFLIPATLIPSMGERYEAYEDAEVRFSAFSLFSKSAVFIAAAGLLNSVPKEFKNAYLLGTILLFFAIVSYLFSGGILGRCIFYGNLGFFFCFPLLCRHGSTAVQRLCVGIGIILFAFSFLEVTQWSLEFHQDILFPYRNIFFTTGMH